MTGLNRRDRRPSIVSSMINSGIIGFVVGSSFSGIISILLYARGGYRGVQLIKHTVLNAGRGGLTFGGFMAIAGALRH